MTDTGPVIDSEACAQMLGCTAMHVEELARTGDIPGLKIGRSWRFVRDDLLAYLGETARAQADERRSMRRAPDDPVKPRRRRVAPSLPVVRTSA